MKPNNFLFGVTMYGLATFITSFLWLIIDRNIIAGVLILIAFMIMMFGVLNKK
ncbi:MAG: hypothetical protein AABY22_22440 [Nanoarchaeota archaeon]